jgi:hypothetical protein
MSLPFIGWRGVFLVMAGLLFLSVVFIYFGIPSSTDPTPHKDSEESVKNGGWLKAYIPILKSGNFLQVMPMGLFNQGGFHALQTLWLGTWFHDLLLMPTNEVANQLFLFNLVILGGYLVNLFVPPFLNKRGISTFHYASVVSGFAVLFQVLALYLPIHYANICLFLFGLCSTSFILAQSQFNQFFPNSISGKASTSFNMLIFLGAMIVQWGIGLLIDQFMANGLLKAEALRLSLQIMLVIQIASFIWMWAAPFVLHPSRFNLKNIR